MLDGGVLWFGGMFVAGIWGIPVVAVVGFVVPVAPVVDVVVVLALALVVLGFVAAAVSVAAAFVSIVSHYPQKNHHSRNTWRTRMRHSRIHWNWIATACDASSCW